MSVTSGAGRQVQVPGGVDHPLTTYALGKPKKQTHTGYECRDEMALFNGCSLVKR